MASPNFGWKNAMPASSIRAGRRRRARPILAANFTGGCADLDTTAGVGRATMDTGQTSLSRCGEAVGVGKAKPRYGVCVECRVVLIPFYSDTL